MAGVYNNMPRPSATTKTTSHARKLPLDLKSLAKMTENGLRVPRQKSGKPGPSVEIQLDNHYRTKVYPSGATVSGRVVVNPPRDVAFTNLEVLFTGIAYARVDFVSQYATSTARPFMKLRMPIPTSHLPSSRVFEAGKPYSVPFNFVVPHQLTLGACSHNVHNAGVRDHHLQLPPAIGYWEYDDMAPDMARIEYSVKARVLQSASEEARSEPLDATQLIKVLPSAPEDAPFDLTADDERYNLSKTKTIRKNLLSGKSGKLTATATQPSPFMFSYDGFRASEATTRLILEFDPATADAVVPKINSVSAKMQASTFFTNVPHDSFPNLGPRVTNRTNPSLSYSTTIPLAVESLETPVWAKHTSRRDSGYSSSWPSDTSSESESASDRQSSKKTKTYPSQTAAVDVRFSIPSSTKKLFLPTFHSCLISRVYSIHMTVSVGPMNTNFNLTVPVQLAVENLYKNSHDELPSFESAIAQAEGEEADLFLQPRLMQVPSARFQGNSTLPGYEEFRRRPVAAA